MAKGQSGRIVIEIDPTLKHELYRALSDREQTLKDWFLASADHFLKKQKRQMAEKLKPSKVQR